MRLLRRDEAWIREQIPLPLEREEVAVIHAEMMRRRQKDRWFFVAFALGMVLALLGVNWLDESVGVFASDFGGRVLKIAVGMVLVAAMGMAVMWLFERRFSLQLRNLLRERGHEVCVPCDYCLAGLGDDVKKCPECGAQREPMPEVKA